MKDLFSVNIPPAKKRYFAPYARIGNAGDEFYHTINSNSIVYQAKNGEKFGNHIEMSGFHCSAIVSYGHDKCRNLMIMRHVVFPNLRCYPNKTSSSQDYNFKGVTFEVGASLEEKVEKITFDGILSIHTSVGDVKITRELFVSRSLPCLAERITAWNTGSKSVRVKINNNDAEVITPKIFGHERKQYKIYCEVSTDELQLNADERKTASAFYCGTDFGDKRLSPDIEQEIKQRREFIDELASTMTVVTPSETINSMCRFAKIRACESIFKTKSGLMHSPGGGNYYAAVWTNDQCEYVNPLFGYLGYNTGFEQAINTYNLYKKYISPDKALITSIISEGDGIWNGAKDRGDSAMYAYGCSRFLLSSGDRELAAKFMKPIKDCIDYTLSKINDDGVVASDSDELENRFESGSANLSTSCIAYDALISFSYLLEEFGDENRAAYYKEKAVSLRENIEKYFGANVEGFNTYRYCKEEKRLRSWICIPLTVGIFDRAKATSDALFSEKLRMREGLVTRSGEKTFWDRSTLYALRGLFYSSETSRSSELLMKYSKVRLLGKHIPYAVEAFPEGNQAQLSAESGLYLRIFTEGIMGIRPIGFNSFTVKPSLPDGWDFTEIRNISICGKKINIFARRTDGGVEVSTSGCENIFIKTGEQATIFLSDKN